MEADGSWSAFEGYEALGLTAGVGQCGQIGAHLAVSVEGAERGVEDGGGSGIGWGLDRVVHPFPFAAGGDDAGIAQVSQVAGDLGLALPEDLDEIADADFAAVHQVEQPEACGIGKSGEEASQIEGFGGAGHVS